MSTDIAQLIQRITSSPGMIKMAAIEKRAKELQLNDSEAVSGYVQAVCKLVTSNLDRTDRARQLVDLVFDAAVEAGPEILQVLADNTALLSALVAQQAGGND